MFEAISLLAQLPLTSSSQYFYPYLFTMALDSSHGEKIDSFIKKKPAVFVSLRPIAAPAALGPAGFAGSTWIIASWIARWWGGPDSPAVFFPFVAFWEQAGAVHCRLYGYAARDVLVTVVYAL